MTTPNSLPSIGFVGLGVMGRPMASHLAAAGYRMHLFDALPGVADALASGMPNARAATTPAALARDCDIVITMVPDGQVVGELVSGADGLLQGFAPGALLLDTSSSEPWLTERTAALLGARGVAMVDAPVSGAQWRAAAAEAGPEASVSELVRWVERTSGTEISAGAVPRARA